MSRLVGRNVRYVVGRGAARCQSVSIMLVV